VAWNDAVVDRAWTAEPNVVLLSYFPTQCLQAMGEHSPARWTQALQRFVNRLPDRSEVLILGDTPAWDQTPVDRLSAHGLGARAPAAVDELIDEPLQTGRRRSRGPDLLRPDVAQRGRLR
jgi:hypothetical protein